MVETVTGTSVEIADIGTFDVLGHRGKVLAVWVDGEKLDEDVTATAKT